MANRVWGWHAVGGMDAGRCAGMGDDKWCGGWEMRL